MCVCVCVCVCAHACVCRMLTRGLDATARLMIVVTMYAEAPEELTTTLEGIAQNLFHMNKKYRETNSTAGVSWEQVVVVVVSDGIQKINNETFRLAEKLGLARQAMIFQSQYVGIVIPDDVEVSHCE